MDQLEFDAKKKNIRDNIATHINMLHALRCGGLDAARSFLRGAMNAGDVAPDGWAAAAHNCHNADDMRSIAMEFLVGDIFTECEVPLPPLEDVVLDFDPFTAPVAPVTPDFEMWFVPEKDV